MEEWMKRMVRQSGPMWGSLAVFPGSEIPEHILLPLYSTFKGFESTYIHTLKADISLGKPWIIKTISLQEKKKTHYQQQSLRSKYDDAHFCNMYILLNIYYIFEMKYEPWPPLTCSPSSSSTFSFIMLHNSSVRIYCVANIRSSFILRICAI